MRLRRTLPGLLPVMLVLLSPAVARADFSPATLESGNATLQADYAYEPAVSSNGDDLVFTGSFGGVTGVYRKDLQTGELDIVAYGDAGSASVSANGQYIAFTTSDASPGDPATTTGQSCPQVYVRNMDLDPTVAQPTGPGTVAASAYTLASALNGASQPIAYSGSARTGCAGGGSATATARSISADGNEVAFTVVGKSDLSTGDPTAITTPAAQIAVRYISSDTTTLVSQTMASLGSAPIAVTGGAAMVDDSTYASNGNPTPTYTNDDADSTAAISADGSTVAWLGINIPAQAPAATTDAADSTDPQSYDEPLWRRIAAGPTSPTRRILGGDDPTCGCQGPLDLQYESSGADNTIGPYRGSFQITGTFLPPGPTVLAPSLAPTLAEAVPAMSSDGNTVAVLSTQPLVGQEPQCAASGCSTSAVSTNVFVVNMGSGLTRAQAMTQVTELGGAGLGASATIGSLAISPEGDQLAFSTERVSFPLSPPTLITPALTTVPAAQLYVADLGEGTLSLASLGFDGKPADGAVASTALSDDGGPIAFASGAGNLVYGSASDIVDGSEVMTTSEEVPLSAAGTSSISASPAATVLVSGQNQIELTAAKLSRGRIMLTVDVPSAGTLRVAARGTLRVTSKVRYHKRVKVRKRLLSAELVSTTAHPAGAGRVELQLAPATRYRSAIDAMGGVYATVTAVFSLGSQAPTLTASTAVEFPAAGAKTKTTGTKTKTKTKTASKGKTTTKPKATITQKHGDPPR